MTDLNMCSIDIDEKGDYFVRGKDKSKCKELLQDITFNEDE